MTRDIANPYQPGQPVAAPAMLFGRQDAVDWLELQIINGARSVIFSGLPLIGKTSFFRHVGALQNFESVNVMVALPHPAEAEGQPPALNPTLQMVIEQLLPQLTDLGLLPPGDTLPGPQPASTLRALLAQAGQKAGNTRLLLFFENLHHLYTDEMALAAGFLSALMPALDDCPNLHLAFSLNQDALKRFKHPLLNSAPAFTLGPLAPDASLNMVTQPVKNLLKFDYGITKRIVEVNSHHPYYLTLFCHTVLKRQIHDGWVNQRDFNAALAEILDSTIEPFTVIWNQSSWVERAVLSGMAAIQGTHGPLTYQEITRFLQRHSPAVTGPTVVKALEALAARGVLVPMGAISFRFHVELLRLWLREHINLSEIIREVDWDRLAAQAKSGAETDRAVTPPAAIAGKRQTRPAGKKRWLWAAAIGTFSFLCTLAAGAVVANQYLDIPLRSLIQAPTPTVAALISKPETGDAPAATATLPPQPTPTATPTPAAVIARTPPSITYMGRDLNQAWRVYVMAADGSGVTPLTPEGQNDTAPIWSPNGQKIAFVSQRDGNRDIYVMDADGQNPVNLTRHPADDWTPAWSSDGSQLAFSSIRTGGWEIYVVDTACFSAPESCPDRLTQLTSDDNWNILPVWSPDGSRMVFNSKAAGNWDVFTMAADGADIRQLTTDPANDLAATWSPDGSQLAFESNRDGNVEIYVMTAAGGSPRNVSNVPLANDHGPAWTPDGQRLVFYSNREGNWDIFITTLDGSGVTNLTNTPERDEQTPAWRP
jgi:hypothetical protein